MQIGIKNKRQRGITIKEQRGITTKEQSGITIKEQSRIKNKPHQQIRILLTTILFSALLTGCGNPTTEPRPASEFLYADTAELRAKQLSNISYDLAITLDAESDTFTGVTEIAFDLVPNNSADLTIDLDQGTVASITRDGQSIDYDYEKWFIRIPASELTPGRNKLVIAYEHPYSSDGSGLYRFVDPADNEVYLYTDFEPYDAHRLFPHFDQPDLKATYKLQVTAPAQWQVISATRETAITKGPTKANNNNGSNNIWTFPESAKFSSYIFSLHAGNYAVWEDQFEDIPLRLFARQSLSPHVVIDEWFTPTKQSFGFFNQYFDVRYPFGKYDQVIVPDFNAGAMENVAAVTFSERYIERGNKSTSSKMRLANVIAHEMAHMWFGDLVTMRWWNGLWLNESFATYMANLAISEASDFDDAWDVFYAGRKQWAYRTDDSVNTHAIELPVDSTGAAMANFDGITYGKGASVLKQLPFYLGEENFRQGVSNYLKKFAYQNTDLDDFMGELGNAAGIDMTQWTQDWLYTAGLNSIKVDYECSDNKITALNINQTAPEGYPTLRQQTVQVGLYNMRDGALRLANAVPVTYAGATTPVVDAIGLSCPDLVYPNEADWGYVKVDLDPKSLASAKQHINAIESSTMRLMLWQSLIDSVSDANLSALDFVEFAKANIATETDYNVAKAIGTGLGRSLDYLSAATRLGVNDYSALHREIEDLYLALLTTAAPGSDLQKYWYDNYVSLSQNDSLSQDNSLSQNDSLSQSQSPAGNKEQGASNKEQGASITEQTHLGNLQAILNGSLSFDGLEIDQDKRWTIVAKLNRYQHQNYKALTTAESQRDNSDLGVNYAIYSEVLRPDPEVKAKWFEVVINNPDKLKLATLRYIMAGLFPAEQLALEQPFKERILAQIPLLNAGEDLGLTRYYVNYLLPTECTAANETKLAQLVIEYSTMQPRIVKAVKGTHQQVQRCIAALELL